MSEISQKIRFVDKLSEAIVDVQHNINSVEYVVLKGSGETETEFLVVYYKGGAKSVRNCTANSCSAIFEELSKILDSGYYAEVAEFNNLINDPRYIRVFE